MKRTVVATTCLGAMWIASSAGQPLNTTPAAREHRELAEVLRTLPAAEAAAVDRDLRKFKIDLAQVIAGTQVLSPGQDFRIQRAVEDRLKPIPISNGVLTPVLPQAPFEYYSPLSPAEQTLLATRAQSIGRLETADGNARALHGTAFVVPGQVIATNCHVLAEIATQSAGGWTLTSETWLDFGEDAAHRDADEFRVTGVAAHSTVRGLDVAILTVEAKSIDQSRSLPPAMPISVAKLTQAAGADAILVGVVGYPDLPRAAETLFKQLKAKTKASKVYSPGAVLSIETMAGVDVLLHVANTMKGNSGSPVLARGALEVIGVHNCCTPGLPPPPVSLACANVLMNRPFRNGAIGSWSAGADSNLGKFFVVPVP